MNDPVEVRKAIRAGRHRRHTAGLAPGYVQGNVCILPREYAEDFRAFADVIETVNQDGHIVLLASPSAVDSAMQGKPGLLQVTDLGL